MVVVMKLSACEAEVAAVRQRLEQSGFQVHFIYGEKRLVMGAMGEGVCSIKHWSGSWIPSSAG